MIRHRIRPTAEPRIDLETVRETLAYMQADMQGSQRLAKVHEALGRVLEEIAVVAPAPVIDAPSNVVEMSADWPRFVRWSPS
jgi:division protein CdvB (Snf7/Vps24/ESCRT-III family)